jgi:hypothetical protein
VRIRVPSQKGNDEYFEALRKSLSQYDAAEAVEVNQFTGSVLLLGNRLELDAVAAIGQSNDLFQIGNPVKPALNNPSHLPGKAVKPLEGLQGAMDQLTGGNLDLSGLIFFLLLGTGVHQILRGNFVAPPWYTAFWYAFGVFTKQLVDKAQEEPAQESKP